jgi:hypothetical protein
MTANIITIGRKPQGRANGTELWATITQDDGTLDITAYRGWGITDEVRLSGRKAASLAFARDIANMLLLWGS